ncbi:MAG: hypothetical protein U1E38_00610 [Rhodospirillales bacterium]
MLAAFDEEDALAQLHAELGAAAPADDALRPVIGVPGGCRWRCIRRRGTCRAARRRRASCGCCAGRAVAGAAQPRRSQLRWERSHNRLEAVFALAAGGAGTGGGGARLLAAVRDGAFHALGYGPAAGFGESLGRHRRPRRGRLRRSCPRRLRFIAARPAAARRVAPLSACIRCWPSRGKVPQEEAVTRMTGWFCARGCRSPKPARNRGGTRCTPRRRRC